MDEGVRRRNLTLAVVAVAFFLLRTAWSHGLLGVVGLPGPHELPDRWNPGEAVQNVFNRHQEELGSPVRMVDTSCEEMSSADSSFGQCTVRLDDGTSQVLLITMEGDEGQFHMQVVATLP